MRCNRFRLRCNSIAGSRSESTAKGHRYGCTLTTISSETGLSVVPGVENCSRRAGLVLPDVSSTQPRNRIRRLSSLLQFGVDAFAQHFKHGVARHIVQREQPFRVRDPR